MTAWWPDLLSAAAASWRQALTLCAASLLLAALTAWVDRRTLARMTGMRRPRRGVPASLVAAVAAMARSPRPRPGPTLVGVFGLLPAGLLLAVMLDRIRLLLQTGSQGPSSWGGAVLLLCLALWLIATCRWLPAVSPREFTFVTTSGLPRVRRRLLETTTSWLGMGVALVLTLLGVGARPEGAHPLAAWVLLLVATLWRRLDEYPCSRIVAGYVGAPAVLLSGVATQMTMAALALMAVLLSGLFAAVSSQPAPGVAAGMAILWILAVSATRILGVLFLSAPAPQRLRRFAWSVLVPLAGLAWIAAAARQVQWTGE